LIFFAKNKGAWGNFLYLQIEDGSDDPGNEFKISVRRQTDAAVVPANFKDSDSAGVFDKLSINANDPNFVVNILKQSSTLIDAQVLVGNQALQRGNHREISAHIASGRQEQLPDQSGQRWVPGRHVTRSGGCFRRSGGRGNRDSGRRGSPGGRGLYAGGGVYGVYLHGGDGGGASRLLLQSGTSSATSSVRVQAASVNDATSLLKLGAGNGGVSQDGLSLRRPAKG